MLLRDLIEKFFQSLINHFPSDQITAITSKILLPWEERDGKWYRVDLHGKVNCGPFNVYALQRVDDDVAKQGYIPLNKEL